MKQYYETLKNYFTKCLEELDYRYDPRLAAEAANIGIILKTIRKIGVDNLTSGKSEKMLASQSEFANTVNNIMQNNPDHLSRVLTEVDTFMTTMQASNPERVKQFVNKLKEIK